MTSGRIRLLVLFVLALLQCFAPLLHAHAHGAAAEGRVHLHGESGGHLLVPHSHEASVFSSFLADHDEAPVIAMAQEFRHDSAIVLSGETPSGLTATFPEPPFVRMLPTEPTHLAFPGGSCAYLSPFSQAPPPVLI